MDTTTIQLSKDTRDLLKDYKTENSYQNYNQAVRAILQRVED